MNFSVQLQEGCTIGMNAQHPHFLFSLQAYLASSLFTSWSISESKAFHWHPIYPPGITGLDTYSFSLPMGTDFPPHFIDHFQVFSQQKCSQRINQVTYNFTMMNSRITTSNKLQITQDNGLDPLQINLLMYQHQLLIPMKISQKQPIISYPIIFKITKCRNQDRLIIYLLSQADLFFLYKVQMDMAHVQSLNSTYNTKIVKLDHFIEMFALFLNQIERGEKDCMISIMDESTLILSITKLYGNKKFEVLELEARKEEEEIIKSMVAYKYGSKRQTIMKKQEKIAQLREMVRLKNPYLLSYFNKM